uniref:Very short patch repair endonuclease n=1 Tax=Bosea sp. NBC_00436 TaxID=2969620 RepID=A0A9E8A1E0_9HYPH
MVDRIPPEKRSANMARVRHKDTHPEMIVRHTAFALGYRYRLHAQGLPGRPDLVFPGKKAVIFVHGCFWHQHHGCRKATIPQSRREFWTAKLNRNVERDREVSLALEEMGWRVLVVWECETRAVASLTERLGTFLKPSRVSAG